MKNADMPAMPTWELDGQGSQEMTAAGLTKREYIAALVVQGLASNSRLVDTGEKRAKLAIKWADALLDELEKQP